MPATHSITRIIADDLFARYSYLLPQTPFVDAAIPNLIILYGDNGSGKTTILNLIFHLLAPEGDQGHRTYLAHKPFRRIGVEFADGLSVFAIRSGNDALTGPYKLEMRRHDNIIAACRVELNTQRPDTQGRVVSQSTDELSRFLDVLSSNQLSIYFLGDDRRVSTSIPKPRSQEEDFLITSWSRAFQRHLEGRQEPSEQRMPLQELALNLAIRRAEQWIRQKVLKGAHIGQGNTNTIYSQLLTHIATREIGASTSSALNPAAMLKTISELGERNNRFSEFGLTSPMNISEFTRPFSEASPANKQIMLRVLQPYIDGLNARLDALQEVQNVLSIFLRNLNAFYIDKQLAFDLSEGMKIISDRGEVLPPSALSSGERQLLLLFCNVLAVRDKPGLFLIDEPELSLNIKWQRKLVSALLECTAGTELQFILATHSVELLALHKNNAVKLESVIQHEHRRRAKNDRRVTGTV